MHTHNDNAATDGLEVTAEAVRSEKILSGCRACLNRLMARQTDLIPFVVRRQTLGQLPFAVAIQAGRIDLCRAIRGYDPRRGRDSRPARVTSLHPQSNTFVA